MGKSIQTKPEPLCPECGAVKIRREHDYISTVDIAWLSAILEGEGSFVWRKRPTRYGIPYIRIGMTDKDIIERVQAIIGGNIREERPQKPHYKTQYRLAISGTPAVNAMKIILSRMGKRRTEKIKQLIKQWEDRPGIQRGYKNPSSKLSSYQVSEIRKKYAKGNESWRTLAIQYGVTHRTIGNVLAGKTYGTG